MWVLHQVPGQFQPFQMKYKKFSDPQPYTVAVLLVFTNWENVIPRDSSESTTALKYFLFHKCIYIFATYVNM